MNIKWAMALVAGTGAVAATMVSGCSGGCVREQHDSAVSVDPAQSCLQLDVAHDQSGVLFCGDGFTVGGVNHCADALSIVPSPSTDAGLVDAGASDGGSPLGPDAQTFAPGASVSFGLDRARGREDADGTLHFDLPATLGAQSLLVHVTLGPKK